MLQCHTKSSYTCVSGQSLPVVHCSATLRTAQHPDELSAGLCAAAGLRAFCSHHNHGTELKVLRMDHAIIPRSVPLFVLLLPVVYPHIIVSVQRLDPFEVLARQDHPEANERQGAC